MRKFATWYSTDGGRTWKTDATLDQSGSADFVPIVRDKDEPTPEYSGVTLRSQSSYYSGSATISRQEDCET